MASHMEPHSTSRLHPIPTQQDGPSRHERSHTFDSGPSMLAVWIPSSRPSHPSPDTKGQSRLGGFLDGHHRAPHTHETKQPVLLLQRRPSGLANASACNGMATRYHCSLVTRQLIKKLVSHTLYLASCACKTGTSNINADESATCSRISNASKASPWLLVTPTFRPHVTAKIQLSRLLARCSCPKYQTYSCVSALSKSAMIWSSCGAQAATSAASTEAGASSNSSAFDIFKSTAVWRRAEPENGHNGSALFWVIHDLIALPHTSPACGAMRCFRPKWCDASKNNL